MKTFKMIRKQDETGVSGTGHVLSGVVFENGKVAVTWYGRSLVTASSVAVYDTFDDFKAIHITSHPANNTEVEWNEY